VKLIKIKLAGFKSFVDPTVIEINGNLVGVVGPNGCGKSNVIDAIRWVLGETSAKQLRGSSMQDVIFNGSQHRKPISRASVELIFDNSLQKFNNIWTNYNEISIKRLLTRSGESLYFINNQVVRKKDVTDLFLGTGLSSKGYAVIEQGMISRIIESKPEDLRFYLEEVAGVSKYKERRKETLSKLEETKLNILRLKDIYLSVTRQISDLEEQAKVANLYLELKNKCDSLQINLLLTKIEIAKNRIEDILSNINLYTKQYDDNTKNLLLMNDKILLVNQEKYKLDIELKNITEEFNNLRTIVAKLEERYKNVLENKKKNELDINEHQLKINYLSDEIIKLNKEEQQYIDLINKNKDDILNLEIELEQQNELYENISEKYNVISQKNITLDNKISQVKQKQSLLLKTIEIKESQLGKIKIKLNEHNIKDNNSNNIEEIIAKLNEIKLQQNEFQKSKIILNDIVNNSKSELANLEYKKNENLDNLNQIKINKSSIKAKITTINDLLLKNSKNTIQLSDYMDNIDNSKILWQNINVENGYELCCKAVLGELIKSIYIDSIKGLKKIPLNGLLLWMNQSNNTIKINENTLANYVKINAKEFNNLYNILNKYIVCDDINQALELLDTLLDDQYIVTKEGSILSNSYIVFGINKTTDNILEYQNKLTLLEEEYNFQTILENQMQQSINVLDFDYKVKNDFLIKNLEKQELLKNNIHESNLFYTKLEQELLQSNKYKDFIVNEIEKLKEEMSSFEIEIQELNVESDFNEDDLEQLLDQKIQITEEYQDLKFDYEKSRDKCKQLELKFNELNNLSKITEQKLFNVKHLLIKNQEQMDSHTSYLVKLKNQIEYNESDLELNKLEIYKQNGLTLIDKINQIDHKIKEVVDEIQIQQKHINQINNLQQKLTSDINMLKLHHEKEKIHIESYEDILRGFNVKISQNRLLDLDIEQADIEIENYKKQIEQLGLVNLKAVEDLKNLQLKESEMQHQINDMEASIEKLELVLKQIDNETRKLLKDTFIRVNESFITYFKVLFGGGSCYLELTDGDILNAGINIFANPLGKKNSLIYLLSGGEKALTAMSLIFAFFSLNPAPFCLLDEVDAPLDDANTLKLCNLIKELAINTQFIYISHNRLAMEMAEQMIGVTMQEKGISIIVNVSLKDSTVYVS
jgi:chromosome segregation protein